MASSTSSDSDVTGSIVFQQKFAIGCEFILGLVVIDAYFSARAPEAGLTLLPILMSPCCDSWAA